MQDLLEPLLAPSTADPNIYRLSLHLNGARRTVHVDALLPVTSTSAPLGVSSDGEDAPAGAGAGWGIKLLEKGWMALRGGWDAVGSNSSVDLHALTGWVPEVLNLRECAPAFLPAGSRAVLTLLHSSQLGIQEGADLDAPALDVCPRCASGLVRPSTSGASAYLSPPRQGCA